MSNICQKCRKYYKVDLMIPDDLWEEIKPEGKPRGSGLLCGPCIMKRIEEISDHDYWFLRKEGLIIREVTPIIGIIEDVLKFCEPTGGEEG